MDKLFERGVRSLKSGDLGMAFRCFLEIRRLLNDYYSNYVEYFIGLSCLARAFTLSHDPTMQISVLMEIKDPNFLFCRDFNVALVHLNTKDYENALFILSNQFNETKLPKLGILCSKICNEMKNYSKGYRFLSQINNEDAGLKEFYQKKALKYKKQAQVESYNKCYKTSIKIAIETLKIAPHDADVISLICENLINLGKKEEAKQFIEQLNSQHERSKNVKNLLDPQSDFMIGTGTK